MDLALGLIETRGLVAAIEAADAMVKAADVKIIGKENVTGALVIIKVMGETAAVKASVDAGAAAAQRVGELISAHVIPRPDNEIDQIIFDSELKKDDIGGSSENIEIEEEIKTKTEKIEDIIPNVKEEKIVKIEKPKIESNLKVTSEKQIEQVSQQKNIKKNLVSVTGKIPSIEQLEVLNVHALRRIARGFDNFPIKGREISKANRAKLLDYFRDLL
jgi:microcompartment protein CcmL/EutN